MGRPSESLPSHSENPHLSFLPVSFGDSLWKPVKSYLASWILIADGRYCTKLLLIESTLQYRFATPNPLKARL